MEWFLHNVERNALYFYAVAALLVFLAYLWMVRLAFRSHVLWGLSVLLVIGVPLFLLFRFRIVRGPVNLLILAGILFIVPACLNLAVPLFIDLGEHNQMVKGERHLTLTGWDKKDYSVLKLFPDTIVLQMRNKDVNDETIQYLAGMKNLRELDLDDTEVTDESLAILASLPKLEVLRLRNTGVTDAGFRQHLMNKASIKRLTVRGTKVTSKTLREWEEADKSRVAN